MKDLYYCPKCKNFPDTYLSCLVMNCNCIPKCGMCMTQLIVKEVEEE